MTDEIENVQTTINKVAKDLAAVGIEKGQRNNHGKYNFRGIDDVYNALSPLLARHGLTIRPTEVLNKTVTQVQTSGGKASWQVTLDVQFAISNAQGSTCLAQFPGEAMDTSDKATNKAMTAAYKYLVFQMFCIPVAGQDADADNHQIEQPAVVGPSMDEDQVKTIRGWMMQTDTDEAAFLAWQQASAIDQIPASRYVNIIQALQRKLARIQENDAPKTEEVKDNG